MNRRNFCLSSATVLLTACTGSLFFKASDNVKKVYIIHGYGATPDNHWFPWLKAILENQNIAVDAVKLPKSHQPDFDLWQTTLAEHIGKPQKNDIFIAHSLGTISLLHYLSKHKPMSIGGLILVSGFGRRLTKLSTINGFNVDAYIDSANLDLAAIRAMSPQIYSIISKNDFIVDPEESLKLAEQLHSKVISVPKGGHFLAQDGFRQLPQILPPLKHFLEP